jgi:hypothetical protein
MSATQLNVNAIIIPSRSYKLCLEYLVINRINKLSDELRSIKLNMKKNGTKDTVKFIVIKNEVASYEKLVSIFKPLGFKVIDDKHFRKICWNIICGSSHELSDIYECTAEDTKTIIDLVRITRRISPNIPDEDIDPEIDSVDVYNHLYDEGEHHNDYKAVEPVDLLAHYKNIRKNLDSLAIENSHMDDYHNELNVYELTVLYVREQCYPETIQYNIEKLQDVFDAKIKAITRDRKKRCNNNN